MIQYISAWRISMVVAMANVANANLVARNVAQAENENDGATPDLVLSHPGRSPMIKLFPVSKSLEVAPIRYRCNIHR